jgi:hypothetical protein
MGNTPDQLAYRAWLEKDLTEYRQRFVEEYLAEPGQGVAVYYFDYIEDLAAMLTQAIEAGRQLQSVTFGSNRPQYQQYALIVYRGQGGGTAW